jgi:hypothetical protein
MAIAGAVGILVSEHCTARVLSTHPREVTPNQQNGV